MSQCEQIGHFLSSDGHCVNCDHVNPEWRAAYLKSCGVTVTMGHLSHNAQYVLNTIDAFDVNTFQGLVDITGEGTEADLYMGLDELQAHELVNEAMRLTPSGRAVLATDTRFDDMPPAAAIALMFKDDLEAEGMDPDAFKAMLKGEV
jgi:hypothetical protein